MLAAGRGRAPRRRRGHAFAVMFAGAAVAVWALAMLLTLTTSGGRDASGRRLVMFAPGTPEDEALAAISRAEARPIGQTRVPFVWLVDTTADGGPRLRAEGAIAVLRDVPLMVTMAGCAAAVPRRGARDLFSRIEPFR